MDEALRVEFNEAAASGRPEAQIVRDLLRDSLSQTRGKGVLDPRQL